MPLASMSNVTSICGMPRGAGGMPSRLNWPRLLLPARHVALALQHVDRHRASGCRRPSRTPAAPWSGSSCSSGSAWSSRRRASRCRATAASRRAAARPCTSPFSTPPWIAAPTATASSGFTSLRGSLPKNSLTLSCTFGMRVMPPTRITSSMSDELDAGVLDRDAARLDRCARSGPRPATRAWRA